ncbi:hypothetical protein [Elizabethkingia meningoseptica]|uniref:hypothetical protein n=1 Tax=Elizabethkingia meningoseptica TaxID=238 RepID=UPI0023B0A45A|nr:hypothetical protein [Elizabethkingia meningoseptica]MDE5429644.1 hypothetical protein [Elizabethkingia meningoseptica]
MFKKKDPYSVTKFYPLLQGDRIIGTISLEYQVSKYDDVQLSDIHLTNDKKIRKYLLHCIQRINIYNENSIALTPDKELDHYDNYPVLINSSIHIQKSPGMDFQVVDYSPQTVNTKVQTSGTTGGTDGKTASSSINNTVGSSTSQTNSYGGSSTFGFQEMADFISLNGSASSNFEHSTTTSTEHSVSTGSDLSHSATHDFSGSTAMSMKDWGAYAFITPKEQSPTWNFGQEYPWDVIECRKTDGTTYKNNKNQIRIIIPDAMANRLYDQTALYPPSQLSTFGVNFVTKSQWLLRIENEITDLITINHFINYFSGSHCIINEDNKRKAAVYLDQLPYILTIKDGKPLTADIDLILTALDPIGIDKKIPIVGFVPNKFIVKPVVATDSKKPVPFKIISTSNTLLFKDTTTYPDNCSSNIGFSALETGLIACFTPNCQKLEITGYFKVVDTINDYKLYIKHWIKSGNHTNNAGIKLTLRINADIDNNEAYIITKYITSPEAEGGEHNLLSISLRNQNYASVDYHDYLQLGLNIIQFIIEPIDQASLADCSYNIRAISLEKD